MSVIFDEDAEGAQEEEEDGPEEPDQTSSGPMMISISTPEKRTKADIPGSTKG